MLRGGGGDTAVIRVCVCVRARAQARVLCALFCGAACKHMQIHTFLSRGR